MARTVAAALTGKKRAVDAAMKAVYCLCKEEIANRKYSSLLSLLELLNTPYVQELRCGENTTYTSDVIANKMQNAMDEVIIVHITKEIQDSPCSSILADESMDISLMKLFVIYTRLVKMDTYKPVTRFVTNV